MKVTVAAGSTAVDFGNSFAHVSLYVLAPTAEPTRAIEEKV